MIILLLLLRRRWRRIRSRGESTLRLKQMLLLLLLQRLRRLGIIIRNRRLLSVLRLRIVSGVVGIRAGGDVCFPESGVNSRGRFFVLEDGLVRAKEDEEDETGDGGADADQCGASVALLRLCEPERKRCVAHDLLNLNEGIPVVHEENRNLTTRGGVASRWLVRRVTIKRINAGFFGRWTRNDAGRVVEGELSARNRRVLAPLARTGTARR